jgi:hypothetical protein
MADPIRFSDFAEFLSAFRNASEKKPALSDWEDAIFHLYLTAGSTNELRFRAGVPFWLFWAAKRILFPAKSGSESASPSKWNPPARRYAFRILATPAHQDTLAAILGQLPSGRLVLYGGTLQSAGADLVTLDSSLSENNGIHSPMERLRALGRSLFTAYSIRNRLAEASVERRWRIPGGFTARMADLLFRYHLELSVLGKNKCPHDFLFLTYELMPEAKAWVEWARAAGKRVIHVMHGQRLPTYQITQATDLMLFSKVDEPWFRKRVDPGVKLWTIGHPRLEAIRREVGMTDAPATPRLPRIAFFSQPSEGDYSRELRLDDWRILAELEGRAEVRFRLHPREDRAIAIADLKAVGADFVELSDAGLKEDLSWCDGVASSWSTVSMEAAACGRGVFWTCSTPEKYDASQELRDAGIGALIQDRDGWDEHLRAWATEGWAAPVMLPEQRLRDLGMIGDMDRPWLERLGID